MIRFNLGAPDFRAAPHLNEVAIEALRAGRSGYCDPAGILSFREAIARHVEGSRGISVDPGPGGGHTRGKATHRLHVSDVCEPGDEVYLPEPRLSDLRVLDHLISVPSRFLCNLSEDQGFAFTADDLSQHLSERTKLIILCSPSNPTGGVLSKDELERIASVVRAEAPARRADLLGRNLRVDPLRRPGAFEHCILPRDGGENRDRQRALEGVRDDGMAARVGCPSDRRRSKCVQAAQHQHRFLRTPLPSGGRGPPPTRTRAPGSRSARWWRSSSVGGIGSSLP